MGDEPPFLVAGQAVSAKYKGAFCEAMVQKVVHSVKCKVTFNKTEGSFSVSDDHIKGTLQVGSTVEALHPVEGQYLKAVLNKIQDCSQYTVAFDDGDVTTLRRTAIRLLKSGRHFAEDETLSEVPLTRPEHLEGERTKGWRSQQALQDDSSEDEVSPKQGKNNEDTEVNIGKVICVEDIKKQKESWFPALVVAPTAQDAVKIRGKDNCLVRSFKDGRYYTVCKKEATEFTRELGSKANSKSLKAAVEKALLYLDRDELPPHWDRELLLRQHEASSTDDSSDDESSEQRDLFVAQLYQFMDNRGTPINEDPTVCGKDVDLFKLFQAVAKHGGYNTVTNLSKWGKVAHKLGFNQHSTSTANEVKLAYKRYFLSFEDSRRQLGRTNKVRRRRESESGHNSGQSLTRDKNKAYGPSTSMAPDKPSHSSMMRKSTEEAEEEDGETGLDVAAGVREKTGDQPASKIDEKRQKSAKKEGRAKQLEDEKKSRSRTKGKPVSVAGKKGKERQPSTAPVKKPVPEVINLTEDSSEDENEVVKEDSGDGENIRDSVDEGQLKQHGGRKKNRDNKTPADSEDEIEVVEVDSGDGVKIGNSVDKGQLKKHGGRKKNRDKNTPADSEERETKRKCADNVSGLPKHVKVQIGDSLNVYYYDTKHNKSNVAYEATVVNVDGNKDSFFVHYKGWNTRHDEWITRDRVVENLSWSEAKSNRSKQQQNQAKSKAFIVKGASTRRGRSLSSGEESRSVISMSSRSKSVVFSANNGAIHSMRSDFSSLDSAYAFGLDPTKKKRKPSGSLVNTDDEPESSLHSLFCGETIPPSPVWNQSIPLPPPILLPPPMIPSFIPSEPPVLELPPPPIDYTSRSCTVDAIPSTSVAGSSRGDQVANEEPWWFTRYSNSDESDDSAPVTDNTLPTTSKSNTTSTSGSRSVARGGSRLPSDSQRDTSDLESMDCSEDDYSKESVAKLKGKKGEGTRKHGYKKHQTHRERMAKKKASGRRSLRQHPATDAPPAAMAVGSDGPSNAMARGSNPPVTAHKPKYNFCEPLDSRNSGEQNIAELEQNMANIRKAHFAERAMRTSVTSRLKEFSRKEKEAEKSGK